MQFKYGSFTHRVDGVALIVSKRPSYGNRGQRTGTITTWNVKGELLGNTTAELLTAIANLENAYSRNYLDAGLYLDDGTATDLKVVSSNTFSGVRVVGGINYPVGDGPEYATERSFDVTLEFEIADASNQLMEFHESISIRGDGGPVVLWTTPIFGTPKPQTVRRFSTVTMTQTGSQKGYSEYLEPNPPIYPEALKRETQSKAYDPPDEVKIVNGALIKRGCPTKWTYEFESSSQFNVLPTVK